MGKENVLDTARGIFFRHKKERKSVIGYNVDES